MATPAESVYRQNGPAIRGYRTANRWTQVELAVVAGISVGTWREAENESRPATAETLAKIAEALGVAVQEIWNPDFPEPAELVRRNVLTQEHVRRYAAGQASIGSLADEIGRDNQYVRRELVKAGAVIRKRGGRQTPRVDPQVDHGVRGG